MDEVRPRQYETETVNINTVGDDLDLGNIKTIDESDLQSFLMGDPVPELDESEGTEIRKVREKGVEDPDEIPSVRKDKSKEKVPPVSRDEVNDYLENDEIPDARTNKEKAKPQDSQSQDDSEEENIFTTLNRDLVKAGIFSDDEDEVGDADSFKNKFVREIQRGANNVVNQFLSQHGPEYREAFDAIFVKGMSPEAYFRQIDVIDNLESLDLKSVDNQERLVKSYYQSQRYSSEKINKKIENLKDSGFLEDEAEAVYEVMLEQEKERLENDVKAAQEDSRRREINRQNYKATIGRLLDDKVRSKSFDGIPVDPKIAGKIYHNLTVDAYELPDGRLITEFDKMIMELDRPDNFERKLKLAFLLEKGLDLSDIKKEAIKSETNDTFAGLQRKKKKKDIPSSDQLRSFF